MQTENPESDLIGEAIVGLANLRQYPLNHIQMDLLEVVKHLIANIDAQAQLRASVPRAVSHAEFLLIRAKARDATALLTWRDLNEAEEAFVQDLDSMPVAGCGHQIEYIPVEWVRDYMAMNEGRGDHSDLSWLKDVYDGPWQVGTIVEVGLYTGEKVMHWQYRVAGNWLTADTIRQREA